MIYSLVMLALLSILAALAGLWVLSRARWFTGFVFGSIGLGAFLVTGAAVAAAFQLTQYDALNNETLVGTATVTAEANSEFNVVLNHNGSVDRLNATGEAWRVRIRRINVPRFLIIGADRHYILIEDVDARFNRLADEESITREASPRPLFRRIGVQTLQWAFNGELLATQRVPVADGAIYTLNLTGGDLQLEPVNEEAQSTL